MVCSETMDAPLSLEDVFAHGFQHAIEQFAAVDSFARTLSADAAEMKSLVVYAELLHVQLQGPTAKRKRRLDLTKDVVIALAGILGLELDAFCLDYDLT